MGKHLRKSGQQYERGKRSRWPTGRCLSIAPAALLLLAPLVRGGGGTEPAAGRGAAPRTAATGVLATPPVAAAPSSDPGPETPGEVPPPDPTPQTTQRSREIVEVLDYMLPSQHLDDALLGELEHRHLEGWTERLSAECSEQFCGDLEVGVRNRNAEITKTLQLPADPLEGCDLEYVLLKRRDGRAREHFCVIRNNVRLFEEKWHAGAAPGSFRRFRVDGPGQGYLWARRRQPMDLSLRNRFTAENFDSCGDTEPEVVPTFTLVEFAGPFNLRRLLDRRALEVLLGPYPEHDEAAIVEELDSLAEQARRPNLPIWILVRREFWSPFDENVLCLARADKRPCYRFEENYVLAKVGNERPERPEIPYALGRVGWQVRHHASPETPSEVWRRSFFTEVVWEEDSYVLPGNACVP